MPRLHHLGFLGQCQLYGLYWIPHSHHDLTFLAFSHPSTISPIAVCCLLWHHITVRDVFSFLPCKICSWYLYQRRRSVHRATEIKAWEQDLAYSHRTWEMQCGAYSCLTLDKGDAAKLLLQPFNVQVPGGAILCFQVTGSTVPTRVAVVVVVVILLEYSWLTVLCSFWVYSKLNQLHTRTHPPFLISLPSGHHRVLSRVPWVTQYVLISHLSYTWVSVMYSCQSQSFNSSSSPSWFPCICSQFLLSLLLSCK